MTYPLSDEALADYAQVYDSNTDPQADVGAADYATI